MTRTKTPAAPSFPPIPPGLAGWRWTMHPNTPELRLTAPDGWETKWYMKAERALAEAERRVLSAPAPALPPDTDAARTLLAAGWEFEGGLTWRSPAGRGERYELEAELAELAAAAAIVERRADISVVDLVASLPAAAPVEDAPPEQLVEGALTLAELMTALDAHAAGLPRPLPLDAAIPLPAGLPERFRAPIEYVRPGRWQPRTVFDESELQDLAASIAEHGVLNPLIVFANEHGFLELIAGERRLRASRLAGLHLVPVEVRSYTMRQVAEIAAIDNLQRADLTAVEEGAIYNRLIQELGISEVALAKRIGRSRGNIQQKRAIASADPQIYQAVQAGAITFTVARTIINAAPGDPKLQVKALKEVQGKLKTGQRLSEQDVKKIADELVFKAAEKQLQALGWQSKTSYTPPGTVVYGPGERPKIWSGAEMLEAVRAARRPAGTEAEAVELSADQAEALKIQGWQWEGLGVGRPWWYSFRMGYNGQPEWLSPAELAARGIEAAVAIATVRERFAAHGWKLGRQGSATLIKHTKGGEEYCYDWASIDAFLKKVEAGQANTKRGTGGTSYYNAQITCPRCKTKTRDTAWIDGTTYCKACGQLVCDEMEAAAAAMQRRAEALIATLQPGPAYDLLALFSCWFRNTPNEKQSIVAMIVHLYNGGRPSERFDAARLAAMLPPDPGAPAESEAAA